MQQAGTCVKYRAAWEQGTRMFRRYALQPVTRRLPSWLVILLPMVATPVAIAL